MWTKTWNGKQKKLLQEPVENVGAGEPTGEIFTLVGLCENMSSSSSHLMKFVTTEVCNVYLECAEENVCI